MPSRFADLIFWSAAVCCIVAQVAVVRSAVRSPMAPGPDANVTMPRRSSEVAWTIIPGIVLLLLLVATWRAIHASVAMPGMPDMPASHRMIDS
jgi:heme/copper-type cytochrome/quinol oxidase subunit 2